MKDQRNPFLFRTRLSGMRKDGINAFMAPLVAASPQDTSILSALKKVWCHGSQRTAQAWLPGLKAPTPRFGLCSSGCLLRSGVTGMACHVQIPSWLYKIKLFKHSGAHTAQHRNVLWTSGLSQSWPKCCWKWRAFLLRCGKWGRFQQVTKTRLWLPFLLTLP